MQDRMASDYKCTLSPELQQKAHDELFEDPETRKQQIEMLRKRLENVTGLKARTDDAFLLRFLRARKFDHERAFTLVTNFYKMKYESSEVFATMTPSHIKQPLEDGVTGMLDHRDKNGCRVMIFRPGRWNPEKYTIWDVFKTNFMSLSKVIQEEETQVHGLRIFVDLNNMTWNHAKHLRPSFAKKVSGLLQEAFPARFKGHHYINEPYFFHVIFSILRPLLKEKTAKRLFLHGKRVEELREYVDEEFLPEEYGGLAPHYDNQKWREMLLRCEEEFKEDLPYGMGIVQEATKTANPVPETSNS